MKLKIIILGIIVLLISCTKPNSENIDLNGVLEYSWDISIDDLKNDFSKKNYTNIEKKDNYISAEIDYNNILSSLFVRYFNDEIYIGGINVRNLDDSNRGDFQKIEDKLLLILTKKYGEPQNIKKETDPEIEEKEDNEFIWNFKNDCTVRLWSIYWEGKIVNLKMIGISFINNKKLNEKELDDKRKEEEERLQWLNENRNNIIGKFSTTHDDFNGITWIEPKQNNTGDTLEKLYLYLGKSDSSKNVWIRLAIKHKYSYSRYNGPLYLKSYQFNIDGKNRSFEPRYNEIKFDNRFTYTYYEDMDINIEGRKDTLYGNLNELLIDIANSKKTVIRFRGSDRFEDREISQDEKDGLKMAFLIYEYFNRGGLFEDLL